MDILKKLKGKDKDVLNIHRPNVNTRYNPEKFIGGVVHEALQYTIAMLSQDVRDLYTGDVQHVEDLNDKSWRVMITLTHLKTRHVITAATIIKVSRIESAGGSKALAQELGVDIGRRLVADIKSVGTPKDVEQGPVTGRAIPTETNKAMQLLKAGLPVHGLDPDSFEPIVPEPEPEPLCDICGATDDMYPEWELKCEHNLDTYGTHVREVDTS